VGLLDKFKDKAGELAQGAKDRVSDATGVDVDQVTDVASSAIDAVDSLSQAAESAKEARDRLSS
jgi:hypothetical protein